MASATEVVRAKLWFCLLILMSVVFLGAHAGSYITIGEPTTYCSDTTSGCRPDVGVLANPISSQKSALTFMPQRLGLCLFNDSAVLSESYDRIISGDRLTRTGIKLDFGVPVREKKACVQSMGHETDVEFLKKAIDGEFVYNFFVDDLPVLWCYQTMSEIVYCSKGFPVGCYIDKNGERQGFCLSAQFSERDTYYIYNHLMFTVHYEPVKLAASKSNSSRVVAGRIVKVTVNPKSQSREQGNFLEPVAIPAKGFKEHITIPFTFDVVWKESDVKWSKRWDEILAGRNTNVLYFSVANTCIIMLFVCPMMLLVLLRTHPRFHKLHMRLKACNDRFTWRQSWRMDEDAWKELENDVFRTPGGSTMLAALCGNATQLFFTAFTVLVGGYVGLLVPANPGLLVRWSMWSYGMSGLPAGFVSRHIYKYIRRRSKGDTKCLALLSVYCRSWLISGLLFGMFLGLNLFHWEEGSSGALDVWSLLRIFLLVVCLPVPCTVVGGWLSYCCMPAPVLRLVEQWPKSDEAPPTPVPKQPCYLWSGVLVFLEGILPFSAIFVPAFFCLSSVWSAQYFYASGVLLVVLFATIIISVCTASFICFCQLCKRNHRWWWYPLLAGVGIAVCYFLYCIYYFTRKLDMNDWASAALFFGYNFIVATVMFLLIGPLCFMGTFLFVTRIYYHLSLTRRQEANVAMDTADTANQDEDDRSEMLKDQSDLRSLSREGWDVLEDSDHMTGQRL